MNLREAQPLGDPGRDLFAHAELDFGAPAMTVSVAEPPPGEAAEVDLGRLGLSRDPIAGPARTVLDDNSSTQNCEVLLLLGHENLPGDAVALGRVPLAVPAAEPLRERGEVVGLP